MHQELIERIENEHETVDALLDRLCSRAPAVDEPALEMLERSLTSTLDGMYDELYRAAAPSDRWRLSPVRSRPREWAGLLRGLRLERLGSPRWWTRLSDLEHRVRGHFLEVENELLEQGA